MAISAGKLHRPNAAMLRMTGSCIMTTSRSILSPHGRHGRRNTGAAINVFTIIAAAVTKPITLPPWTHILAAGAVARC
jgi:hypothetical protein